MNKKYVILTLVVLTILGSLFTALASNMLFSDIINIAAGSSTLFATLPAASVALFFIVAVLYVLRTYKHPDCKKRITRLYSIYLIAFGVLGLVGAILSGATIYHTFVGPNPFPGYLIIFMVLDVALIGCGVYSLLNLKKMKEDEGKVQIKVSYVFKTIGWFLFIALVFNRLGMLFGAPFYVYLRNLYKTFPFYIYLLVPLYLGVVVTFKTLDLFDNKKRMIMGFVGLGINVALFAYIAIMGITDTNFISSLSQAMPLERMASKPVEILIHFLAYTGVGIAIVLTNKKAKQ